MKKLKIGDVFQICTDKGEGYFQYVHNNETIGELIRVFPMVFNNPPKNFENVVEGQSYFIHFPLKSAYSRGIVKYIGNFDVPNSVELPKKMRSKMVDDQGEFVSWQIVDYNTWQRENVKELSDEERELSPWGTWNDTLLTKRLEQGWTPEKWL